MSDYPQDDARYSLERALEAVKNQDFELARHEAEAATSLIEAAELTKEK